MNSKQYETLVVDAEHRLTRLRSLYDQWFAGVERAPPAREQGDFDRLMQQLRAVQPRNTAARFRYGQLVQRYLTYTTYWRRVTRQIEEGTSRRDLLHKRRVQRTVAAPADDRPSLGPDDGPPDAEAAAPSADSPELSDQQIRAIYERFVAARKHNRERVDNVSLEAVAANVRNALPRLLQKHAGKRIDFEAVLRHGKVALKPVAK